MIPQVAYLLLTVLAAIILGGLVIIGWQHRQTRSGWPFTALIAMSFGWAVLVALMAVVPPELARQLLGVKAFFIAGSAATTFVFLGVHARAMRLTPLRLGAMGVWAVFGVVISWRDGAGMLAATEFSRLDGLTYISALEIGPLYLLFVGVNVALTLGGVAFVVAAIVRGGRLAKVQGTLLIVGAFAPLFANLLLISGIAPRQYDPMPLGHAVCGVVLWAAVFRHGLLDLVPIARSALVESLDHGIMILDDLGRVIDLNRTMATLVGDEGRTLLGRTLLEARVSAPEARDALVRATTLALTSSGTANARVTLEPITIGTRVFDIEIVPVSQRVDGAAARIVMLRDVTARQTWFAEQARLIHELQHALGEVRTLTGLLPICANCKQIRDDKGNWSDLEQYIRARTDAEFTHGICPSCASHLYPESAT